MAAPSHGLIATFDTAPALYQAAQQVRDAGYRNWDCITPFPVHGLDSEMGLKRSIVPRISLAGGITGFFTGMTMIWWTGGYDYKLTVGGNVSASSIDITAWMMRPGDDRIVADRLFALLSEKRSPKPAPAAPAAPPEPSKEEKLLTEIRDAIRARH